MPISVIITYNSVNGFKPGWHGGNRLFIHSLDEETQGKWGNDVAKDGPNFLDQFCQTLEDRLNIAINRVNEVYLYVGETFLGQALDLVVWLRNHNPQARWVVVACACGWKEKSERVEMMQSSLSYVEMIMCECGGQEFLGRLARRLLSEQQ